MRQFRRLSLLLALLSLGVLLSSVSPAWAQLDLNFNKPLTLNPGGSNPEVTVNAQFNAALGEKPGILSITAKIPHGFHIYSLTQKKPPQKTIIELVKSDKYQLLSGFLSQEKPKYSFNQELPGDWKDVRMEEYHDSVTFYAPLSLAPGVDAESLVIEGQLDFQICDAATCRPSKVSFAARLSEEVVIPPEALGSGNEKPADLAGSTEYRKPNSAVVIKAELVPSQVLPGGKATLKITAEPDPTWHVYAVARKMNPDAIGAGMPTLIVLEETSGLTTYHATTTSEVIEKETALGDVNRYHAGPVTWTVEIDVPEKAPAGTYPLTGLIGYQVCTDSSCQQPVAAQFKTEVKVGDAEITTPGAVSFTSAEYSTVSEAALDYQPLMPIGAAPEFELSGLLWVLPTAFLGGLILNLMPCVLPVVGLKILSLVEQAGHNKREALQLNLAFTAGVLTIFMALATMAVVLNLSWGQQFQSPLFNIVLTAILFVFALSFLGVWEIPLPGFVGSGKASEAANEEGYAGAFFKGALSTVLATPCSGPALGAVFALTLSMPPAASYLLFFTIGLGMASPYLLVGAFPALVRWLPKPGAWMDTFKQITGFIMLGAVVVMFKFFVKVDDVVPAFGLLIGLWFGCWWIGRTPLYESRPKLIKAWVFGTVLALVCGVGGFKLLMPREHILPWEPFSQAKLAELQAEGKTVMVEFTADWCLTCQVNMAAAIDTEDVRLALEKNGAVPLLADWTDRSDEIKRVLNSLGSNSIPLLAIYPADRPDEPPILLRDLITKNQLLEKIEEATVSKDTDQAKADENVRGDSAVNWQPFSPERAQQLRADGNTVLVMYTADWCLTCQANKRQLNQSNKFLAALRDKKIIPLLADWTDHSDAIKESINNLGSDSIPLIAIYPADLTQAPIVLRDIVTENQVMAAINSAQTQRPLDEIMATATMK